MDCERIKNLIPNYLDGELETSESKEVREHLMSCAACQKEAQMLDKAWNMLGEWKNIEPSPNYVSRFWTELSERKSWHEAVFSRLKEGLLKKRLAPALIAVCALLIVGLFSVQNYFQVQQADVFIAGLSEDELEMVENFELVENFDIIEDIEFLEDLDIIESLEEVDFLTFSQQRGFHAVS